MNTTYRDELEIDFVEFIKMAILRWKIIVLLAVIGGLVFGGAKYLKDSSRSTNTKEITDEEIEQELLSGFNASEIDSVSIVADRIKRVDLMVDFADNASKMSINPLNCRKLELIYSVKVDNPQDINLAEIMFEQYISSDEFTDELAEAMDLDSEKNYVDSLVECNNGDLLQAFGDENGFVRQASNGVFNIVVLLPENADEEKVPDRIKKSIEGYQDSISRTCSGCQIDCVSEKVYTDTDLKAQEEKTEFATTIINEKNAIKSTVSGYSDNQKEYLGLCLKKNGFTDDELVLYTNDTSVASLSKNRKESSNESASFSLKWTILGMFLFVMCYLSVVLLGAVIKPKAGRLFGFGKLSGSPVLGTVIDSNSNIKWLERKINRIDGNPDRMVHSVVSSMNFHADSEDENELTLLGFEGSSSEIEFIRDEWNKQYKNKIESVELSLDETDRVSLFDKLGCVKKCFIVIRNNSVLVKELDRIADLIGDKNIDVIGIVEVL